MKKLLLPVGLFSGIAGLAFSNIIVIALALALLAWYGNTDLRATMLDTHSKNLSGETLKLGELDVPIANCALELPVYRLVFPEVSQLLTWRDTANGTITQIRLITNLAGKTLAYPAAVLKAA